MVGADVGALDVVAAVVVVVVVDGVSRAKKGREDWRLVMELERGLGAGMVVVVITGEDTARTGTSLACVVVITPPLVFVCVNCAVSARMICICCAFVSASRLMLAFCSCICVRSKFTSSRSSFTTSDNSVSRRWEIGGRVDVVVAVVAQAQQCQAYGTRREYAACACACVCVGACMLVTVRAPTSRSM